MTTRLIEVDISLTMHAEDAGAAEQAVCEALRLISDLIEEQEVYARERQGGEND